MVGGMGDRRARSRLCANRITRRRSGGCGAWWWRGLRRETGAEEYYCRMYENSSLRFRSPSHALSVSSRIEYKFDFEKKIDFAAARFSSESGVLFAGPRTEARSGPANNTRFACPRIAKGPRFYYSVPFTSRWAGWRTTVVSKWPKNEKGGAVSVALPGTQVTRIGHGRCKIVCISDESFSNIRTLG